MLLTWAYELTPEGMKKTKPVPISESIGKVTGRKLDFVIIGLLVLAVGFMFVDNYLPEPEPFARAEIDPSSLEAPSTAVDVVEPTPAQEEREVLPNSVAVLLCDNLSPNPDDAYIAASIHDEILNQLFKIRALSVIAKTSVMQYADGPPPISQIAEELNVEAVMECSVRYAGDAILVTAQLIDPETNIHLWSDTYPGDMSDLSTVFAIQADIAMNIANEVGAEFSLAEQASIEKAPTDSPAAYSFYLSSLARWGDQTESWRDPLDRAIALDQNFSLAYATRAYLNTWGLLGIGGGGPDQVEDLERLILEDADRALMLDPTLGTAQAALAVLHQVNWRGADAEEAFRRASELSPNDANVLMMYGRFKRYRNEHAEGIRLVRRAIELDPHNPLPRFQIAINYRDASEWDAAAGTYREAVIDNPTNIGAHVGLAVSAAALGDRAEALSSLQVAETFDLPDFRLAQLAHAYRLLAQPEDVLRVIDAIEDAANEKTVGDGLWASVYIAAGDYERALALLESAVNSRRSVDFATLTYLSANPWDYPELEREEFRALFSRLWIDE